MNQTIIVDKLGPRQSEDRGTCVCSCLNLVACDKEKELPTTCILHPKSWDHPPQLREEPVTIQPSSSWVQHPNPCWQLPTCEKIPKHLDQLPVTCLKLSSNWENESGNFVGDKPVTIQPSRSWVQHPSPCWELPTCENMPNKIDQLPFTCLKLSSNWDEDEESGHNICHGESTSRNQFKKMHGYR